jgi:hypothetical protein
MNTLSKSWIYDPMIVCWTDKQHMANMGKAHGTRFQTLDDIYKTMQYSYAHFTSEFKAIALKLNST